MEPLCARLRAVWSRSVRSVVLLFDLHGVHCAYDLLPALPQHYYQLDFHRVLKSVKRAHDRGECIISTNVGISLAIELLGLYCTLENNFRIVEVI